MRCQIQHICKNTSFQGIFHSQRDTTALNAKSTAHTCVPYGNKRSLQHSNQTILTRHITSHHITAEIHIVMFDCIRIAQVRLLPFMG
ncbi:hypothetical protein B398_02235 [Xylella fastidiosa 32]|nr:hypothetical protein B398_02235 [Xylella fastidiosa 32]